MQPLINYVTDEKYQELETAGATVWKGVNGMPDRLYYQEEVYIRAADMPNQPWRSQAVPPTNPSADRDKPSSDEALVCHHNPPREHHLLTVPTTDTTHSKEE